MDQSQLCTNSINYVAKIADEECNFDEEFDRPNKIGEIPVKNIKELN